MLAFLGMFNPPIKKFLYETNTTYQLKMEILCLARSGITLYYLFQNQAMIQ